MLRQLCWVAWASDKPLATGASRMQRSAAVSEAGERARTPDLYTNALCLPRKHL
ncbi:hypothetical protein CGCS363_v001653 [Colletotrichum siamense]|uniref:uncharacterized protein n=1 Tax=Colletotrichum siamense TaxID=690259 RepID=UPI00187291CB|nr:uncharacterized protein CGCS363_v001653 [Colletotrichum siamense]KAF5516713.1 hypothetical protein CGCS363_v001653 [Colletotrichum siamense]